MWIKYTPLHIEINLHVNIYKTQVQWTPKKCLYLHLFANAEWKFFLLLFVVFLYKIQSPYCNEQANA